MAQVLLTGTGNGTQSRGINAPIAMAAAGTGYAPGDTWTAAGGVLIGGGAASVITLDTTQVVTASLVAGGTGGTPGAAVVTGTTGTGSFFQLDVTISGLGVMTSVDGILDAGGYTVNPTNVASEPVTGGGLTGAIVSVGMGVLEGTVTDPGQYTTPPSSPVAQGSTSGGGSGATFTCFFGGSVVRGAMTMSLSFFDPVATNLVSDGSNYTSIAYGDPSFASGTQVYEAVMVTGANAAADDGVALTPQAPAVEAGTPATFTTALSVEMRAADADGNMAAGVWKEVQIFSVAKDSTTRSLIRSNIMTYFGIT